MCEESDRPAIDRGHDYRDGLNHFHHQYLVKTAMVPRCPDVFTMNLADLNRINSSIKYSVPALSLHRAPLNTNLVAECKWETSYLLS